MKKLTTFFLTLALIAGLGFAVQAKNPPKKDSYEALKNDPKSGIGKTLSEITKKDKDNLFTAKLFNGVANKLRVFKSYRT